MALGYFATWPDVCNLALSRLLKGSITALTDGTVNAIYCSRHLPQAIEEVLTAHPWIGMSKRNAKLTREETGPVTGFSYFHTLPTDFVRVGAGSKDYPAIDTGGNPYRIEQGKIATDAEEVALTYVFQPAEADIGKVPRPITVAIAATLAVILTTPFTSSAEIKKDVQIWREEAMRTALETDGRGRDDDDYAAAVGFTWYDEMR